MVNFPSVYDAILRKGLLPSCMIYKDGNSGKNYAGACLVVGLRIKLYINEDMTTGSFYQIRLDNLRNPDYFDSSFYKWVIEVADTDARTLYQRSFATTSNFQMKNFGQ